MENYYKKFLAEATKAGRLGDYSPEELQLASSQPEYGMASLRLKQGARSMTPQQRAMAMAAQNEIDFGAKTPKIGQQFEWGGETAYQQLLNQVLNRPAFSYNPDADEGYKSYKKTMLREGDRAQDNTLAKTSALTGGVPSSWAVAATDQAGNYHASKIADALPSFRQIALNAYNQQGQDLQNRLGLLSKERNWAHQQYLANMQKAMQLWNMGQQTKELADILGIEWQEPAASGYGYGGGGGTGMSFAEQYRLADKNGAPDYNLAASLQQAMNQGLIDQKEANELHTEHWRNRRKNGKH